MDAQITNQPQWDEDTYQFVCAYIPLEWDVDLITAILYRVKGTPMDQVLSRQIMDIGGKDDAGVITDRDEASFFSYLHALRV